MVPDLPPVLIHDLVPDMVPDLQPDMVPDLQPVFCNNFVIKHGIRYASSSVARSVTRRGARSCIISPDLPPIGTQGAENTSQHAELKLTLLFAEIIAKSMPSNRCAFRSLAAQVYRRLVGGFWVSFGLFFECFSMVSCISLLSSS